MTMDPRWHVTEIGNLIIEAVQKSDEANYVCRAENMVGSRDSDSIRLDVHGNFSCFDYSRNLSQIYNDGPMLLSIRVRQFF